MHIHHTISIDVNSIGVNAIAIKVETDRVIVANHGPCMAWTSSPSGHQRLAAFLCPRRQSGVGTSILRIKVCQTTHSRTIQMVVYPIFQHRQTFGRIHLKIIPCVQAVVHGIVI